MKLIPHAIFFRNCLAVCLLLLIFNNNCFTQSFTLSGYITEKETGEALVYANVYELNTKTGATTNAYGFYSMSFPADSALQIVFSYVGFKADTVQLKLTKDSILNKQLNILNNVLTVEVKANRNERIENRIEMSQFKLDIKEIKKIPAFLGEIDILKALQLTPGVQSGNEGLSGLYVRGGSPDQNLVLLDDIPIYNTGHVLGIFSIFNADAIKDVRLIKGGFPARYGGRLSSILDIKMKEGNLNEFHGAASISLISSKLTLEGPIKKGKTSFLISARRSYLDLLASPLIGADKFKAFFHDVNIKLQHKINDKHRLFFSGYTGVDIFEYQEKDEEEIIGNGIDWKNIISSLRWNYQINAKLFSNTSLSYSKYKFATNQIFIDEDVDLRSAYFSGIRDFRLKTNFDFIPNNKHYIKLGGSITQHNYNPGALSIDGTNSNESIDSLIKTTQFSALEFKTYLEDTWTITPKIVLNAGVHFSAFQVDNTTYHSWQPRLSANFKIHDRIALKASFAKMEQYINLLTSEALSLPTDLWVPSTKTVLPQQSWQASLGLVASIKNDIELSLDFFNKQMNNVLSYKEGANFLLDFESDWQDKITQGEGKVYGLEFLVRKTKGKLTGWIGYTYSKNTRQFSDINNGKIYPFRYDRKHDASIVLTYELNERISMSTAWVYGTGNAISLPKQKYATRPDYLRPIGVGTFEPVDQERVIIEAKNDYRLSNYHRLDFTISYFKKKKRFDRTLSFSVYNVYNHVNPYFAKIDDEFVEDPITGDLQEQIYLVEIGILPFVPSIAYSIKF